MQFYNDSYKYNIEDEVFISQLETSYATMEMKNKQLK